MKFKICCKFLISFSDLGIQLAAGTLNFYVSTLNLGDFSIIKLFLNWLTMAASSTALSSWSFNYSPLLLLCCCFYDPSNCGLCWLPSFVFLTFCPIIHSPRPSAITVSHIISVEQSCYTWTQALSQTFTSVSQVRVLGAHLPPKQAVCTAQLKGERVNHGGSFRNKAQRTEVAAQFWMQILSQSVPEWSGPTHNSSGVQLHSKKRKIPEATGKRKWSNEHA